MTKPLNHFLDLHDFTGDQLRKIIADARHMKDARIGQPKGQREANLPLKGKILAMIFERPSTRTRISFEVAMRQLGGEAIIISASETQMGRGETVADTARVLSRFVDGIMVRAANHSTLLELAKYATVPVINGLTNKTHPAQVMADVMTLEEHVGPLAEQTIAWLGDGNNVAASWIEAVAKMGGRLRLGCPEPLAPHADLLTWAKDMKADVSVMSSPQEAVNGAHCVITDAWLSMHDTDNASRHNMLRPYQVNAALMAQASPQAIFMHCLPAHRNEEVTDDIIDGPQSVVFDEAENRLHIQKAILLHAMSNHD